jgi:hypothetical protein
MDFIRWRRAALAGGALGSLDRTGDRSPRTARETAPPTIGGNPIDVQAGMHPAI